jgi:hypothetical protein
VLILGDKKVGKTVFFFKKFLNFSTGTFVSFNSK